MSLLDQIELIVWDFDGVLNRNYDENGFIWQRTLHADWGIDTDAFSKLAFQDGNFATVMRGERPLHGYLVEVFQKLSIDIPIDEFTDYWFERDFHLDARIAPLIECAMAKNVQCVVGTNNEPLRANVIIEKVKQHYGIDVVFASGHLNTAKPDKAFFNHIIGDRQIPQPQAALLIDDTPACITGASACGWRTLQYGDSKSFALGHPDDIETALIGMP